MIRLLRPLATLGALGTACLCLSCAGTPSDPSAPLRWDLLMQAQPAILGPSPPQTVGPAVQAYLKQWKSRLKDISYTQTVLTLPSDGRFLGMNVFQVPEKPRGTLFQLHGYLANSLTFAGIDGVFLKQAWTVTALDLPGHGMSQGPRADVDVWSRYGDAVRDWLAWAARYPKVFPRPWVIVAHSLGGSAVIDYYHRRPALIADRTILAAPLIHPTWYTWEGIGFFLIGWFVPSLPPVVAPEDYLSITSFPTHWFAALQAWNARKNHWRPWRGPQGSVYQGTNDSVVDGAYDVPWVEKEFPGFESYWLKGATHEFLTQPDQEKEAWEILLKDLARHGLPVTLKGTP